MSLLTSTLNQASLALGHPLALEPMGEVYGPRAWPTVDKAFFFPIAPQIAPFTIGSVNILVSVQAGNIDIAIVSVSGTTATRLASTGSTAVGAAGSQTIALTSAVTLAPGRSDYYVGVAASNATFQPVCVAAIDQHLSLSVLRGGLAKTSSMPIAASTTTLIATDNTQTPWVRLVRS
jgi:hypothetical protein